MSLSPTQPSRPGRLLGYAVICSALTLTVFVSAWNISELNSEFRALFVYVVLWLIWPWITLLALAVFQVSMQRARIKTIHVARCVFYSFDAGAWVGIIFGLTAAASLVLPGSVAMPEERFVLVVFFALLAVAFYRMWRAYRCYLKFDHAFLTVFASAVMTSLLGHSFYLDFENYFIRR